MSAVESAVYYMGSYDIVDPGVFKQYPPRVMALLQKYGGEVLASDTSAYVLEGEPRSMNAIIRFRSKEAALGMYTDADYQEAKRIRQASTRNATLLLVQAFAAQARGRDAGSHPDGFRRRGGA